MGRLYSVEFENVSVSALQDLFELAPADDKPICLHGINIDQISDVGDAAEEILRIKVIRGHSSSGSGGSSATPRPLMPSDTAAGFAAEVNNTTVASSGTALDMHSAAFNIRVGWLFIPTPEMRIWCSQASGVILNVQLVAAPADAVTMSGTAYVEEIG